MTKPCNFPERVNRRRIAALARLETRRTDTLKRQADVAAERAALMAAIVADASAVRTKKNRSGRAQVRA